jgi:type VI secretion system secreted protein VgrG
MPATYTQDNRPMRSTTPLGKDALLLVGFSGTEAISQLFSFRLDFLATNQTAVPFEKLLGQKVTVEFAVPKRHFNGIVNRISEGERDETFTSYQLEIVPQFWLLTRRTQSRIFQHISVPDILRKVFEGLDVDYQIQGSFPERDYCVQYRESDFNFASRLMEEEGIYYFFKHTESGHKMVVANSPMGHPELTEKSKIIYENILGGTRKEDRIYDWAKVQELRSGKYLLWDHCFELPHKHLEANKDTQIEVAVGTVTHKLKVGGNDKLELYDYPGEYAQRFDGVDAGGGDQPADVQKIFKDNQRTVEIRMQQETLPGLRSQGASNCHHLVSGHKFTLERHFNADGQYVLTSIQHTAKLDAYRSKQETYSYNNTFTCIPFALPFRPPCVTPCPTVLGSQTAVVVGPPGEEIFTDKYSRVKVQFHWDREGKNNADSSCWIRVATHWAGKQWGMIHIPRIGQEVVVDFAEGDPDQPIIVGSVYNAEQMPPYKLPDEKTKSTLQSRSTKGGGPKNFNEIRLEDKKGSEQIFINAEKDMDHRVENDSREFIKKDRHLIVEANQIELVKADKHSHVKGKLVEKVGGDLSLTVGAKRQEKIGTIDTVEAGQEIHLKAGMKVIIEAGVQISLVGPGGFIDIGPAGVTIQGTMVLINSGGSAGNGTASTPETPKDPDVADDGTKTGKLN